MRVRVLIYPSIDSSIAAMADQGGIPVLQGWHSTARAAAWFDGMFGNSPRLLAW